jgi:hypothetical protein
MLPNITFVSVGLLGFNVIESFEVTEREQMRHYKIF